jgi:hypothetical protein
LNQNLLTSALQQVFLFSAQQRHHSETINFRQHHSTPQPTSTHANYQPTHHLTQPLLQSGTGRSRERLQ